MAHKPKQVIQQPKPVQADYLETLPEHGSNAAIAAAMGVVGMPGATPMIDAIKEQRAVDQMTTRRKEGVLPSPPAGAGGYQSPTADQAEKMGYHADEVNRCVEEGLPWWTSADGEMAGCYDKDSIAPKPGAYVPPGPSPSEAADRAQQPRAGEDFCSPSYLDRHPDMEPSQKAGCDISNRMRNHPLEKISKEIICTIASIGSKVGEPISSAMDIVCTADSLGAFDQP